MIPMRLRYPAGGTGAGILGLLLVGLLAGCAESVTPPVQLVASLVESPAAADERTPVADQGAVAKADSAAADQTVTVGSCDGENTVTVAKELAGQPLADALMDQWERDHPDLTWVRDQKEKHSLPAPADNSDLLKGGQGAEHAYGNFTELDLVTWARETEKFVARGSQIFHSADELGSTIAVSCDMCHPNGANTHPETYPKFQTQLGRVALLRDMINWCIENPVRGQKLAEDSAELRALEAYILATRKGVPLNFGKH